MSNRFAESVELNWLTTVKSFPPASVSGYSFGILTLKMWVYISLDIYGFLIPFFTCVKCQPFPHRKAWIWSSPSWKVSLLEVCWVTQQLLSPFCFMRSTVSWYDVLNVCVNLSSITFSKNSSISRVLCLWNLPSEFLLIHSKTSFEASKPRKWAILLSPSVRLLRRSS